MNRWIAALVCLCIVATSCPHMAEVPPKSIEDTDAIAGTWYRIETTDGHEYLSNRVARTDTGFVVHMLRREWSRRPGVTDVTVDPLQIPFDQVVSMRAQEHSNARTAVFVVSMVAVAYVMVALAVSRSFATPTY